MINDENKKNEEFEALEQKITYLESKLNENDDDLFVKVDYDNPDGNLVALKNPKSNLIQTLILAVVGVSMFFLIAPLILYLGTRIYLNVNDLPYNYYKEVLSKSVTYLGISNAVVYTITLIAILLTLFFQKKLKETFKPFLKWRTYIYGIGFGMIVLLVSAFYNFIAKQIAPVTTPNVNQSTVELLITKMPLLMFLIIPFFGPFVEEFIYRLGLFQLLKKIHPIIAYVLIGIIFGFIHFNIPAQGDEFVPKLINEFINLPGYIISGLLFCFIYDKENFATATVAHVTNNFIAFFAGIISLGIF